MKSTPKRVLSLFMSLLMLLSVTSGLTFTSFADDERKTYGDFKYIIDEYGINIWYEGTDTEITIPSEIEGTPVTYLVLERLAKNANDEDVTTFNIPASVTSIGGFNALSSNTVFNFASGSPYTYDNGFVYYDTGSGRRLEIIYNCYSSSVSIPEGVTDISSGAFDYAPFSELYLPASMTELNSDILYVFRLMYPESINISNNNPNYSSVDGVIFNKDKTELIFYPGMKNYSAGTYTVPDGVERIGDYAFSNANIKEVILPDSVHSIGDNAFANSSIEKISLPDAITEIGYDAFLGSAYYNDKNNWENNALYFDNYLIKAEDSEDYETFDIKNGTTLIAGGAFEDYLSLKKVNIPSSVTSIGEYAFSGCLSLTDITIPDSITSISYGVFANCLSLADIVIPDSVTSIGDFAFLYCMSLKDITIPDSVTSIGYGAFECCMSLTDITIPDSITAIGEESFAGCVYLTDIDIPDSVTSIGEGAFAYCVSLSDITIPDSVTSIGEMAFSACVSLSDIVIPNSVENIADGTFRFCLSLENVTLPDSLKSIGDCAFCYTNLKNINLPDNLQTIVDNAFYNLKVTDDREPLNELFNGYIEEYIGNYVKMAEEYGIDLTFNTDALADCLSNTLLRGDNEITNVTIPKSVTEIGVDAFGYSCTFTYDEDSHLDGIVNKTENFTIYGYKDTAAEEYANNNDFKFVDLDPSSELILADGSNAVVDYSKNIISILGMRTNTIGYLKSQFESELETSLDDDALITDGTTVSFDGTEYKVLVRGDMNGDGNITVADCRSMLKTAAGFYEPSDDELIRADINSDGEAGTMEVRSVLRFVARLTAYSIDESINDTADIAEDAENPSVSMQYQFTGKNELTCDFYIDNISNHLTSRLGISIPDGLTVTEFADFWGSTLIYNGEADNNTIAAAAVTAKEFNDEKINIISVKFEISDDADMDNIVFNVLDGSCVDDSIPLSGELKVETYSESFEYTENGDGTITITGFTPAADSTGTLEIPSQIDGKTVTGIESYILNGDYEAVTIPETITSELSSYTFSYLDNLKDITVRENNSEYSSADGVLYSKDKTTLIYCPQARTGALSIPDGVIYLDKNALFYCRYLTEISFPASLKTKDYGRYMISGESFSECDRLERITVDENSEYFSSVDGALMNKDKTELICCPKTTAGTYSVPDGVTEIRFGAFSHCSSITEVIIPSSLSESYSIGYIFAESYGLEKITVDENNENFSSVDGVLYSKDKSVLFAYPKMKGNSFTVPSFVNEINYNAFFDNGNITDIVIPDSVTKIGNDAFYNCADLSQITMSDNITSIGSNAFSYTAYYNDGNNWENEYLYLDNYLLNFNNWNDAESVSIKDSTVLIADSVFHYDEKLKEVNIPDSMKYIGKYAFEHCSSLEKITIPDSVVSVGVGAFEDCASLKNVTLSNSLTSIEDSTFSNCSSLEKITLPDSVITVGAYTFSNCSSLENVIIPNSVTAINMCAFRECTSLKEINLSESLTYIGQEAFSSCPALESVHIPDSVSYIDGWAFYDCSNLTSVTIPKNTTEIMDAAFGYYRTPNDIEKLDGFTIRGYKGTAAEEYANENGFTFIDLDSQVECEHKNTVVKNAVSATCTTAGYTGDTYCADCNAKITEGNTIPALGHKSETVKGKSATCTEKGLTDGTKCSVCGVTLIAQKPIPALGHKSETVKGKNATCTEKGLTDGTKCSVCGKVIKAQTEIPSLGHTSEVITGKPATCTEKGLTDGEKCSVCGIVIKEQTEIPALGHTSEVITGKPAACTETGLTDGEKCSVCGAVIKEQTEIPSLGHTSEVVSGKPATCTETGLTDGEKCSVCGEIIKAQTEIPAIGHKSETVKGKSATCTEKGLTDGTKCSVCGKVIKAQTEIPAIGHKSETVKGKSATCTEKGLTDGTKCSVCGKIIKAQSEIPALGHTSEVVNGKGATCTESGLTNGEKCSVCGEVIKAQSEIPALGHTFENGVCTVCGAKDPDFKLVLAENHDKNITLDNEKKTVTSVPSSVSGMTAGELKSQFGAQIELDLDDSSLVPNGTKFTYNGEEYTIIVKGDVSADGKITAADARALLRIAAKLDNPDDVTSAAADIDSNGKITSTEARNILRFAARLSSTIDG